MLKLFAYWWILPYLLSLAGVIGSQYFFRQGQLSFAVWCSLATLVVTAIAAWLPLRKTEHDQEPPKSLPWYVEVLLMVVVLGLAAGIRLYRLTEIPPYIFVDEAHKAIDAAAIAEGRLVSPFTVGWWGVPTLYFYYASVFITMFGRTEIAMRLPCAISGIVAVWLFYPMARMAFGAKWAPLLTLLYACSRWHGNFSRWGGEEIAMNVPWGLCLLGIVWSLRCKPAWCGNSNDDHPWYSLTRLCPAVLAGFGLGLGFYTYPSARLLPLGIGAFFLHQLLCRRKFISRHLPSAILVVIVSGVVFAPLAIDFWHNRQHVMRRYEETNVFREVHHQGQWTPLLSNLNKHLMMFHGPGDNNGRHNLPREPMLAVMTGALFLLGLGVIMGRIGDPLPALCLFGMLASLAGGVLTNSHEAPQAFRTVAIVPLIYMTIGLGLTRIAYALWHIKRSVLLSWIWWGVALVVVVVSSWSEVVFYFTHQTHNHSVLYGFNPDPTVGSREVAELLRESPDHQVFVYPQLYGWATMRYFLPTHFEGDPRHSQIQQFEPTRHLPLTTDPPRDTTIFLHSSQRTLLEQVQQFYPNAQIIERWIEELNLLAYLRVEIPLAMQQDETQGLMGTYQSVDQPVSVIERRDRQIAFDWTDSASIPDGYEQGFEVSWNGVVVFRESFSGKLILGTDETGTISAPGKIAIDDELVYEFLWTGEPVVAHATPVVLAPGVHGLSVHSAWTPGMTDGLYLLKEAQHQPAELISTANLFVFQLPVNGLWATYYPTPDWSGEPLFRRKERVVEADQGVEAPFSVRWEGYLRIDHPGTYRLEPNSDDGCEIYVNGQSVGKDLGPDAQQPRIVTPIELPPGYHHLRIDYYELGGGRGLTIWFYPPRGDRVILPSELLYPKPPENNTP